MFEPTDSPTMLEVRLKPHPASPESPIDTLTVLFERDGLALWLRFVAEGQMPEVVWPGPVEPGRADDLWRHSCFEAFVQADDGYVEYNLSPSGQWATYRFDDYRRGMRAADQGAEIMTFEVSPDRAELTGRIALDKGFPPLRSSRRKPGPSALGAPASGESSGGGPGQGAPQQNWVPAFAGMSGKKVGLSAVIEAIDGTFSYWALAHPSDKPDFHHPDSFVLELP